MKLIQVSKTNTTYTFELQAEEKVLGMIQIRKQASKAQNVPTGFESNIYYEIFPEFRGNNFGTEILHQGLIKAAKLGMKEIVLTCKDANIPSRKVIENNGGILIDSQKDTKGDVYHKFKISLTQTLHQ